MLKNGENPFVRDTRVHVGTDSDGNTVEIFKTTCVVPKRTKDNGRHKMANKSVGAPTYKVVSKNSDDYREVSTLREAREIAGVNTASKKLASGSTKPKADYPEQQKGYSRG